MDQDGRDWNRFIHIISVIVGGIFTVVVGVLSVPPCKSDFSEEG